MAKRRIRLDLAYDGSDFKGWQIQTKGRTVQAEIEKILFKMEGAFVRLTGSGRTDSGVHANCQVAHFDFEYCQIPGSHLCRAFNSQLPRDIRILESQEVSADFHARFNAVERGYRYYIYPEGVAPLFRRNYCWETRSTHNLALLNQYAGYLVGQHDFTSFARSRDANLTKLRMITSASFLMEDGFLVFSISGNAFLWKMVRSITGTLIGLEKKGEKPQRVKQILESKNRNLAGVTAPARALFLDFIRYPGDPGGTRFEYDDVIGETLGESD